VHVPAAVNVTELPVTLQTLAVNDEKTMGLPEAPPVAETE
jgi:hypothetical protein